MIRDPDHANFAAVSAAVSAGFLIWAAHFLVIYGVTALACARGFADVDVLGMGAVELVIGAATLVAIIAAGTVLVRAFRRPGVEGGGSEPFLRWTTAAAALLALVAIAWQASPILFMRPCQ